MATDLCKPIPITNIVNMTNDCQPTNFSVIAQSDAGASQPSPSAAVDIDGRSMFQITILFHLQYTFFVFLQNLKETFAGV